MSTSLISGRALLLLSCLGAACGGSDDGEGGAWLGEGNGDGDGHSGSSSNASGDGTGPGGGGATNNTGDDGSTLTFDVSGGQGNGNGGDGDCDEGESPSGNFSVIWIANSVEGTVSKIDTVSAAELARYRTGPGTPDPSRTSVNLFGDVAVGNRSGSITKIAAKSEDCIDANNDGTIQTSSGPTDILAWGQDECVLWHTDLGFTAPAGSPDNQGGPRAVAWNAGIELEDGCFSDPQVWVGWRDQPSSSVKIKRLDGETGEVDGDVLVENWWGQWGHGPYGAAADAAGGIWILGSSGTILYIDPDDLGVTRWNVPITQVLYGISLDADGVPWIAGYHGNLFHFDAETGTMTDHGKLGGDVQVLRGLAMDADKNAWVAGNLFCKLLRYDTDADVLVDANIELPGCVEPVGVSIDMEGYIWVVDRGANGAYKIDPDTQEVKSFVDGLVAPYTYSDMTGWGLGLVVNPPIG